MLKSKKANPGTNRATLSKLAAGTRATAGAGWTLDGETARHTTRLSYGLQPGHAARDDGDAGRGGVVAARRGGDVVVGRGLSAR